MARRSHPQRIHVARREATIAGPIRSGELPERAAALVAQYEAQTTAEGREMVRAYSGVRRVAQHAAAELSAVVFREGKSDPRDRAGGHLVLLGRDGQHLRLVVRVVDGRLTEHWNIVDMANLMAGGRAPAPPSAGRG
jgi:hypothetical protein